MSKFIAIKLVFDPANGFTVKKRLRFVFSDKKSAQAFAEKRNNEVKRNDKLMVIYRYQAALDGIPSLPTSG